MRIRNLIWILLAALAAGACEANDGYKVPAQAELVNVDLSLGVGGGARTKGDPAVVTEMNSSFRGITETIILPFEERRQVLAGDYCLDNPCLPGGILSTGLVENNNSHLFTGTTVSLPKHTASVLAYGRTPIVDYLYNELLTKQVYGAQAEENLSDMGTVRDPAAISFSPVPIYDGGIPSEGTQIADILGDVVAAASATTDFWYYENGVWKSGQVAVSWDSETDNVNLREWYDWITNDGRIMAGSGRNVESMLTRLYRLFKSYTSSNWDSYTFAATTGTMTVVKTEGGDDTLTWADIYNNLRDEILYRFEHNPDLVVNVSGTTYTVRFADHRLTNYPGSYGLPDGAAVIRWNGTGFQPVDESIDGAAPVSRFCFPPKLWYFANTTIRTSCDDLSDLYTSASAGWDDILSEYRDGIAITSETRAVALEEQLQYSCGMLVCTVRATSAILDDGDGDPTTTVKATGTNFPITGVILGGQKKLGFDFTPKDGEDQYFMYDNRISGVYLTDETSAPLKSLVSQTADGENVYFCLELRNDSGVIFAGAEGDIMPGSTFYLVGSMDMPPVESGFSSVFVRDHTSAVNCVVPSLAQALNSIPDLENPRLTLGVQANMNWVQSTPIYIILY